MKKLLVILGAGSSIPCGMPSVGDLDGLTRAWGQEWAVDRGWPDVFETLWQATETYYRNSGHHLRPAVNFEKVLGEMIALASWITPAPWGNTLRQVFGVSATPPGLAFPFPTDYGPAVTVADQLCHILIALAAHMRTASRAFDPATGHAQNYAKLLMGLRDGFEVGIYNLNYDTVALTASPSAFTGFDGSGTFDPKGVHQRREWNFIYHLHGSVHHSLVGAFGDRIEWRADLAGPFDDGHQGRSPDKRSDNKSFPKTTLIAGGFKLDQLLIEPFQSFYAALVRHVYDADAILIGGYGFSDVHVNRALRNRLEVASGSDRSPVMILDHASIDKEPYTDPMAFRADVWSHEVCCTLHANGHAFREPGHAATPDLAELVAEEAFEVESSHRVALWHGGFTSAAERLDGIVPWLDGADDVALIPPAGP